MSFNARDIINVREMESKESVIVDSKISDTPALVINVTKTDFQYLLMYDYQIDDGNSPAFYYLKYNGNDGKRYDRYIDLSKIHSKDLEDGYSNYRLNDIEYLKVMRKFIHYQEYIEQDDNYYIVQREANEVRKAYK